VLDGESYHERFPKGLLRKCLHVDGGTHTGVPCSSTSGASVTATLYDIATVTATVFTAAALAAATENSPGATEQRWACADSRPPRPAS
jgi:hypothetical protein